MRKSWWFVALVSSVAVAVLPLAGSPAAVWTVPSGGWLVPTPGSSSALNGVTCTSASNCWAIGEYVTGSGTGVIQKNQALHWNGRTWATVSIPSPSGNINQLSGVSCTSATNCWAVGSYEASNAGGLNQAFHWNGTTWSKVTTPNPGGTASSDFSELLSVTCTSATNCWAAGHYGDSFMGNTVILTQALHWNGRTWTQAATPNPAGITVGETNTLTSVGCVSASDCWAVGSYGPNSGDGADLNLALRWDGRQWSQVPTPNPGGTSSHDFSTLQGLSCTSASDCWASGSSGIHGLGVTATFLTQALHWDGTTWSPVATPNPDGTGAGASNQLRGVRCLTASDCWAIGDDGSLASTTGAILNLALRWDGTAWVRVSTPDPAGADNGDANHLNGIGCTSTVNCWAVGHQQHNGGHDVNQALHWNGSTWSSA